MSLVDSYAAEQQHAIDEFWQWWNSGGADLLDRVFTGKAKANVAELVHPKIAAISEELQWEFSPGIDGARHALTVTGVGTELRAVVRRWFEAAPPTDQTWSFSQFRLPKADPNLRFHYAGIDVNLGEMTLAYDEQDSLVDIEVYHPAFTQVDAVPQLGYLLLDFCFGELDVELWVGAINFVTEEPAGAVPAVDLKSVLAALKAKFPLEGNRSWRTAGTDTPDGPIMVRVSPPLVALSAPQFTVHVEVTLTYEEAREDGLPTKPTLDALNAIEDAVDSALAMDGHCVGIETGLGRRIMHCYTAADSEAIPRMREVLALWDRGGIELNPSMDPHWGNVSHLRF